MIDPKQKALSLYEEFKNFAFKGNVVDLAIGVIIGAAFGKIIDSLVKDVVMPLIGTIAPHEKGYEGWLMSIRGQQIKIGVFIGTLINFLIVALALWLFIVKFLGAILRSKKEAPPPPLTKDQELLSEIRDLLKKEKAPT